MPKDSRHRRHTSFRKLVRETGILAAELAVVIVVLRLFGVQI